MLVANTYVECRWRRTTWTFQQTNKFHYLLLLGKKVSSWEKVRMSAYRCEVQAFPPNLSFLPSLAFFPLNTLPPEAAPLRIRTSMQQLVSRGDSPVECWAMLCGEGIWFLNVEAEGYLLYAKRAAGKLEFGNQGEKELRK